MITKRIIANLVVFFAVSMALVVYGAVSLFGNPLRDRRTVVADLPEAGGLRPGFSASHDGVVIGTVSKLSLHEGGVRVTVELDPGKTVPSGVVAKVVRASAVGEQRLDLVSTDSTPGPTLADGAKVPAAPKDPIPPDVADVLDTTNALFDALPADDLNTVVHELAVGFDGRAGDLKAITRSLTTINDDYLDVQPELRKLLADGPSVLDDYTAMSPAAHKALENTQVLTQILANRDDDLVKLVQNGGDLSEVFDRVLLDDRASLTCLTSDLADVNHALQGETLAAFDRSLAINQEFFGAVDKVAQRGASADVGYGPAQSDALWLRTRLLLPAEKPAASRYVPPRAPRPITYGSGCTNRYGSGADAVTGPENPVDPRLAKAPSSADRPSGIADRAASAAGSGPVDRSRDPHDGDGGNRFLIPLIILGLGTLAVLAVPRLRHLRRAP